MDFSGHMFGRELSFFHDKYCCSEFVSMDVERSGEVPRLVWTAREAEIV